MITVDSIKEKIGLLLIEKDGDVKPHELKFIIDEAKKIGITDKRIAKLVPEVDREINWEHIRKKKEEEKERLRKFEEETHKKEEEIKSAPEFIDSLIQYTLLDGIVESKELQLIFAKADQFKQDNIALSRKIKSTLDANKFNPYPSPDLKASTLKDILLSTNWYNPQQYTIVTTPPPSPPEPFPWKIIIIAFLLITSFAGIIGYQFFYLPWLKDKNAPRYYTYANNAIFRSTNIAQVDYNKIMTLPYGSELITYTYNKDWLYGKIGEKEGYVYTKLTLDKKDFYLLNSIFGDTESKATVETIKCRNALLEHFKKKGYMGKMDTTIQREVFGQSQPQKEVWQVFSKAKDINPNTVYFPRVYNPGSKYTDFAVIIKNINTGKRKLLIFTFSDTEEHKLIREEDAPDFGDIVSIKKVKKKGVDIIDIKYSQK